MEQLHQGQPLLHAGDPVTSAKAAMILIHGRGASASDILSLTRELDITGFTCFAPEAAGGAWYPYRFMEPVEKNEPYLTSALNIVEDLLTNLNDAGIPPTQVILLGFSQGACLVSEYAARFPQRYGGVAVLSGGLIGNGTTLREYSGSLDNTAVFIGCSDRDAHIPLSRVQESTAALRKLGAEVEERIYPNMGHTINQDELEAVQQMMNKLVGE
jgi:predicted esterase